MELGIILVGRDDILEEEAVADLEVIFAAVEIAQEDIEDRPPGSQMRFRPGRASRCCLKDFFQHRHELRIGRCEELVGRDVVLDACEVGFEGALHGDAHGDFVQTAPHIVENAVHALDGFGSRVGDLPVYGEGIDDLASPKLASSSSGAIYFLSKLLI